MPVNYTPADSRSLAVIDGVELGIAKAHVRKPDRKDLLLARFASGSVASAVFTRNQMCAAPVILAREHLRQSGGALRALVVNTGFANAGTGASGLADARAVCEAAARAAGCRSSEVLPCSTGVIMERLPVERIVAGLEGCVADLRADNWLSAAEAIMTTDTVPKAASRSRSIAGAQVNVTGIAKGSGMIRPDMATMLALIATDASVSRAALDGAIAYAVERSFNRITVDGDMSTNDTLVLAATGRAATARIESAAGEDYRAFADLVTEVAAELAQAIVRDGEGATKFVTLEIEGGASEEECLRVGYAIAHSPLVKTAFYASDPNLGRILAAIGYSGVTDLDVGRVELYIDDVHVATAGGRHPGYREEQGQQAMSKAEFLVRVDLRRGTSRTTLWTCDLSHDYVKINAEYRT